MEKTKSPLELEAEKCKSVPTARDKAEAILARMNDMLRQVVLRCPYRKAVRSAKRETS